MSRKKKGKKKSRRGKSGPYSFEFRLRVVRMYLEEQYPIQLICKETGVGRSTLGAWVRRYRQHGEEGLRTKPKSVPQKSRIDNAVKDKILEAKKSNPVFGVRRISDFLKRFFHLQASPGTVHRTLADAELIEKRRPQRKKNHSKPRFFERTTPNQLWQSDICTFRLAGRNAYLIGFIDDYSRYITGLGLYRSQTAEHVLETFRRAAGEYGIPREMLTDNGRQYVNWRGTTKFEKELKKDRIKHIRSQPHHPMTLGKMERFWKTILQEFLLRSQFDSFENARERIELWVKYYNHRRPHQGISGLCPADRYFEIQNELKQVIDRGIEENCLEMALRGRPHSPFYMVGRMNDQNVVIRAEKGKVRMMVDEALGSKELVYDMKKEDSDHGSEEENQDQADIHSRREARGGSFRLDGTENRGGDLPGDEVELGAAGPLAEPGDGRDAVRPGAEKEGAGAGIARSPTETVGEETFFQERRDREIGGEAGNGAAQASEPSSFVTKPEDHEHIREKTATGEESQAAGGYYHESPFRGHNGHRRGSRLGHIP
jgi:transposase InsO family protein